MTATEFNMPSLGADMEDGVVSEWLVEPGDEVQRGQVVVIVETDKSDIEVEIFDHAVIDEILIPEGERVAVGVPIARLRPVGAPAPEPAPEPDAAPAAAPKPDDVPQPAATGAPTAIRPITSPLVRHLADELHVDTTTLHGTGPGGRVHRDDVLEAATSAPPAVPVARTPSSRRKVTPRARRLAADRGIVADDLVPDRGVVTGDDVLTAPAPAPAAAPAAGVAAPDTSAPEGEDPARRAVAALMTRSWAEIPHFHVTTRIDLSEPMAKLAAVNEGRPMTERLIPAAVLLHAVAQTARRHGALNGWWGSGRFRAAEHVDLGVVVALRRGGIIVPTIPRADDLTVDELMTQLTALVGRARAGRLRSSDVAEASLTVTNLGDLGTDAVYGVIHPPQVALVGLGAIHPEPVAVGDESVVRPVVHATLAGDHRALDGLVGATFLSKFTTAIHESAASIPARRPADPEEQT